MKFHMNLGATNSRANESGRSMTEMLGVLAIIGVLSVAGIVGYKYAIAKYHANQLSNEVMKRAVVLSQCILKSGYNQCDDALKEFAAGSDGITYATPAGYPTQVMSFVAQNAPLNVCQVLLRNLPDAVIGVGIVEKTGDMDADSGCYLDKSDIEFYFNADLSPENKKCSGKGINLSVNGGCSCFEDYFGTSCEEKGSDWTPWRSSNTPKFGPTYGNYENRASIEAKYPEDFKNCPTIKRIECRAIKFPDNPISELKQNVSCNLSDGLVCNNKDMSLESLVPMCYNYEVRFKCGE